LLKLDKGICESKKTYLETYVSSSTYLKMWMKPNGWNFTTGRTNNIRERSVPKGRIRERSHKESETE
jgi:hypothetical protein